MRASVIIPAFNEEASLERCLQSIRGQSFGPDEIIVADGGSTDGTLGIAERLADKVVVERKRTISAGRQAGAQKAGGRWLVFGDADTFYPKNWLLDLLRPFVRPDVVCTHGKVLLDEGNAAEQFLADKVAPPFFRAALLLGYPSGAGSNLAIRSDVFRRIGGFNTDLVTGEDVDLQRKALPFGKNVFVDDAVVFVSPRRIRQWGYARFLGFHAQNWLRYALVRRPHHHYEAVRKG